LNADGHFITKGSVISSVTSSSSNPSSSSSPSLLPFTIFKGSSGARHDVGKTVMNDLEQVGKEQQQELQTLFNNNNPNNETFGSDRERNKRLLFLFQKDLLSGLSGKILESKDRRDYLVLTPVSMRVKWFAWMILLVCNTGMLVYVFLFAVGQEESRQLAWSKSFGIWLLMEIFVISSMITLVTHVLIPSLIMKDVQEIKKKLVLNVASYYQDLSAEVDVIKDNKMSANSSLDDEKEQAKSFNAASYLFVSYRVAKAFPELKASKIIAGFKTVWPRQSYQHVTDLTSSYSKKFSAFTRSASLVILFFLTSVINLPSMIHDLVFQTLAVILSGSVVLLHQALSNITCVDCLACIRLVGSLVCVYHASS
jgi:uncharacterized membrane protein